MKWLALSGLLMAGCSPEKTTTSTREPEVDALIEQLIEGSIEERDQAARALIDCGHKSEARLRAMISTANERDGQLLRDLLDRIAVPRPLRGVLRPVPRVTIIAANRSAREVLEEFQRLTGTPMRLNNVGKEPISVWVKNLGPLEALDAICRAARFGWYFESNSGMGGLRDPDDPPQPGLTLHDAPVIGFGTNYSDVRPKLFIRHYQVEVVELKVCPEGSRQGKRTQLNLGLYWPGCVKPHSVEYDLTSAIDDRGFELLRGHDDPGEPAGPRREKYLGNDPHRLFHRFRLCHPDERSSAALASIRGTARFSYLLGDKTVAFDNPEESVGVVKQVEGMTAEILEVTPVQSPRTKPCLLARVRIQGRKSATPPLVRIRRENGSLEWTTVMNGKGNPGEFVVDIYLVDQPSRIVGFEVVLESICAEDVVKFEFKDVPFPK